MSPFCLPLLGTTSGSTRRILAPRVKSAGTPIKTQKHGPIQPLRAAGSQHNPPHRDSPITIVSSSIEAGLDSHEKPMMFSALPSMSPSTLGADVFAGNHAKNLRGMRLAHVMEVGESGNRHIFQDMGAHRRTTQATHPQGAGCQETRMLIMSSSSLLLIEPPPTLFVPHESPALRVA